MMYKPWIYLATLILFSSYVSGQQCDCIADFNFVADNIENGHPGYKRDVLKQNKQKYFLIKDSIKHEISARIYSKSECQKTIREYLDVIRDKHLQIYDPELYNEARYLQTFTSRNLPQYVDLDDETAYLKVPSFNYKLWKDLDNFYDSIIPVLAVKKFIILDIRNNGGGGERMYNQLLKILKKSSKKSKVGIIFNRHCASACEEVALEMTDNKHIITFGENTNGQFAYGFIKEYKTPGCNLSFIITTKRYPKRLKYEYVGVTPKVILTDKNETDWITEVLNILKR